MFANLMDPLSPRATVFIFTTNKNIARKACRKDAKKAQSSTRPPYSAEACQGETKEGNDGKTYKSVQTEIKKGKRKGKTYWRWKHVKEEPAAQKKPARDSVRVFHRNIQKTDGIAVEEALAGGASPSFKDQIKGALMGLKDRKGLSVPAIKKFLNATPAQYRFVNEALNKGVKSGFFIKNQGKYKLSPRAKKHTQKKKKKKKKRTSSSPKKKRTTSTKKKKLTPGDVITGSKLLELGEVTQEYTDERGEVFRIESHLGYHDERPDIIQYSEYLGPVARGMFDMPRKGFVLWYPNRGKSKQNEYGVNNLFDTYIVSQKTFRKNLNDYYNRLHCLDVKRYGPNDKFTFIKEVSPGDASWRDPEYSNKRVYPRDLFIEEHPGKDSGKAWRHSSINVKEKYFEKAYDQRATLAGTQPGLWGFRVPNFRYMNAEAKADHVQQMKEKREQRESGKPKRPLTAYMLFVHEHQEKSSKEIGRLWRTTSQKEKKKYLTRAQNDRERYRKEMETYVRPKKKKDAKKKSQKKK